MIKDFFRIFSNKVSNLAGTASAFVFAVAIVAVWATTGPAFHFSDTWQLVINTGTTIVTFLMVFLIQNTQNRDGKAVQLKLDELIRSSKPARDSFIDLEDLTDKELAILDNEFKLVHDKMGKEMQIHKWHHKVEQERMRRTKNIAHHATKAISNLLHIAAGEDPRKKP